MRRAGRLAGGAALRLLLAAQAVAALEPISMAIAVGAASALTGYLSYTDLYCRLVECCPKEQPLNASGTAGRPGGARGAGPGGRPPARGAHPRVGGVGEDAWDPGRDSRPGSRRLPSQVRRVAGPRPRPFPSVRTPLGSQKKLKARPALLRHAGPFK